MGSKNRIAKEILPIILKDRKEGQFFVDLMTGGANLIDKVSGNRIANDANVYLIAMWKELLKGWIPEKIDKCFYDYVKNNKEKCDNFLVGWIGFNCSYSGKWFAGFAGSVMTKNGTIRDYQEEAIRNVLKQIKLLKGVLFYDKYYFNVHIPENSIVYLDPPYKNTTGYDNEFNHDYFWDYARKLSTEGHSVFISEYNAPEDFECIWQKQVKSSLSANGKIGGNKNSIEKLFILKP